MNRDALLYAARATAEYVGLALGGTIALSAAIWLPTLGLQYLAGWPFLDAYSVGAPLGLGGLCIIAIGVLSYRQRLRQMAAPSSSTEDR